MKKTFGFAMAATMAIGGAASADVLYDNPIGSGTAVNQEFGDVAIYSTYLVADINIPDPGFTLTQVTGFYTFSGPGGAWDGITMARLILFPKTGALPVGADDPTAGLLVPVTYDVNTGILTTVGLSVDVTSGDYWIGLTAAGDFGVFGQQFNIGGANVNGELDAYRNPGGAFNFPDGTNWGAIANWAAMVDIAIIVEGDPLAPDCPWDLDGSGSVGTSDLLALFAQWGTDGAADFDGSGAVGTADLLILFAHWGPC